MKVFLQTFGCRANQYDSEVVRGMVERAGGSVVDVPEEADVALFNSCAVTSDAVADLRQQVRRTARRAPHVRSVVMGCAAAVDDGSLATLPTVSDVIGGAEFAAIARALQLPAVDARPQRQSGARALLRIQDGCNEHCTFCVTTIARGANRSRGVESLIDEARRLAVHHREIVLTGIHIGTWGHDIGSSLGVLVERLVGDVDGVRFRLASIEATEVDARLRALMSDGARLAPHLHAPLQSGSDRLLRRMGRHWYTASSYARAVERLHDAHPVFALGADLICGFPGETEEDHRATVDLVRALPFTYLHVFPFSPRPGTAATRLPDPVAPGLARERAAELRALGATKEAAYRKSRDGGRADVVVVKGGPREGLTEDYLTVRVLDEGQGRGTRFSARLCFDDRILTARIA